jgi:hypothetical protein
LFFSALWLCLGSFLVCAADAAASGAVADALAAHGPDLTIGRGILSCPPFFAFQGSMVSIET